MSAINAIATIGFSAVFAAFIYVGKKLQVLDELQVTTSKIKVNLKIVSDHLTSNSKDFNHKELQVYSPLKLTPEGKKLIETLGFDSVFQRHKDDFFAYLEGEEPKLKYDVESAAIRSISALYGQDYMEFLKVFFYNHPERNLQNVGPTLGIYVRDKYLAKHPEITE
jgi:hypothetical protein